MKEYYWLNDESRIFLSRGYLKDGQTAEARIKEIADNAEYILGISGFSDKFVSYMSKGYYSLSTPVWTNFGNSRGLPVSCYGSAVGDSIDSILTKSSEIGMMSKLGGGTSAYFGDLRPRGSSISVGGESDGPVRFLELFDNVANVISQGKARRGTFAAYLPVEHPDVLEFLRIKSDGHPIQDTNFGVTITDKWMEEMLNGDQNKKIIWSTIIRKRFETGYPYIVFIDTCNNNAPKEYKINNLKIKASNVCSEIVLSSDEDNSFVCVLSSVNLLHWDEIKKTDAVETLTYFLDAVNEEFCQKVKDISFMGPAYNFATKQRALGLGVLGWHSLLQSKMIPFESFEAQTLNIDIFKTIKDRSLEASCHMAKKYGEPELLKGSGRRNMTTMAVAPTKSSSFILGQVSQGIEPFNSNYYVEKLAKGNFTYKNEFLLNLLESKGKNYKYVWKDILHHGGSVQHVDFLTDEEKSVFKTFGEISQKEIVIQAAQRQKYIDQGQSLNLMIHPSVPAKQASNLLIEGWRMGVKCFYYQRSANPAQELSRNIMNCVSCEG